MFQWFRKLWRDPEPAPSIVPKPDSLLRVARAKAQRTGSVLAQSYPIQAPTHARGVLPITKAGLTLRAPVAVAMDSWDMNFPGIGMGHFVHQDVAGFPGYPYLSMLATRAEYRAMASALATELTREWIIINSTETADDATKDKVTELTKAIEDMGLQQIIRCAAEHDAYFGRAQIFIDVDNQDRNLPLLISPKTVKKGAKIRLSTVEAIWTTPAGYNALDPASPEFYKPPTWFMLGKQVHASRLMTVITRPLPDMLKPAFDFGGMSLSQIAEPYVNNWLRTRQSVADLINNFSITVLATAMSQVVSGGDDGTDLFERADLFTAAKSNRGLMLVDKDTEEIVKVDTSLAGLHELQSACQEHMCAVSRLPAIILTGISPSGLNASSEGEIRTFYDWIAAQQEAHWWKPIQVVFQLLQLSMYGEIDPDLTWSFVSLFQMTPKELAEIRVADSVEAQNYFNIGAIDNMEVREKLARSPESGYQGIDLGKEIIPPEQLMTENEADDDKQDK